jgi:hypothetical protein
VHQHALAAAGVEARVLERQCLDVGGQRLRVQPALGDRVPRRCDHRLADVDADDASLAADAPREREHVVADAAAGIEDAVAVAQAQPVDDLRLARHDSRQAVGDGDEAQKEAHVVRSGRRR